MAAETHPFYALWAQGDIRDRLFIHLSKSDICAVRLANSACCNLVTRRLFQRVQISFTANAFTRPYRIDALGRVGQHIEHLTFYLPHSDATFLPPLIHPQTGAEITYLYTPHTSATSTLTRPKYGNSELADILTQQYPPLFHAATNVPSFIHAVKNLPNLRHLTVKTPGQNPAERYRRDIVDYALMSLRIAVERNPSMSKLSKLSLHGVHPAAFLYLKFQDGPGFGCSPAAGKRWRQIRRMHIAVDSWDFYGPGGPGLDQLKIMDDYLRQFSDSLEKLSFTWLGRKGPCPLALVDDPLFETPRENRKLFNEVTSPMSPLPARPGVKGTIHFPKLKYLQVRNATMNESQLRRLVGIHRETVREFDFENVILINGGSWDKALAPLMSSREARSPQRDTWARYSLGGSSIAQPETSPVPEEALSPMTMTSRHSIAQDDEIEIRHSAAVDAVGKELLDLEIEGLEAYVGLSQTSSEPTLRGFTDDPDGDKEEIMIELDEGLDSAINIRTNSTAGASQTSLAFSTKLKKRRRRRKPWHPKRDGDALSDDEGTVANSLHHTKSNRSQDTLVAKEKTSLRNMLSHKRSNSSSQSNKLHKAPPPPVHAPEFFSSRVRQSSDPIPYTGGNNSTVYELPLVIASDDENLLPTMAKNFKKDNASSATLRPRATSHPPAPSYPPPAPPALLNISAPIISTDALPVLLQPTVYNPTASTASVPLPPSSRGSGGTYEASIAPSTSTKYSTNGNGHNVNDGLSAVQRNLEQEEIQRRFAEDAEARTSALKRAREAVLEKLGRLNGTNTKEEEGLLDLHPALQDSRPRCDAGHGGNGGRFRELFGAVKNPHDNGPVYENPEGPGSSSVLVPLVFSRSLTG